MNVPEYARHRGLSPQAIRKGIKSGRLVRSVSRDAQGRVAIDVTVADREWAENTNLLKRPAARAAFAPGRPLPAAAAALVDDTTRRLAAIVAADLADLQRYLLELVPPLIEGAVEALRSAGREPAELVTALGLEPEDEDAGIDLLVVLHNIVNEGLGGGIAVDVARQAGREAVTGRRPGKGGADGVA